MVSSVTNTASRVNGRRQSKPGSSSTKSGPVATWCGLSIPSPKNKNKALPPTPTPRSERDVVPDEIGDISIGISASDLTAHNDMPAVTDGEEMDTSVSAFTLEPSIYKVDREENVEEEIGKLWWQVDETSKELDEGWRKLKAQGPNEECYGKTLRRSKKGRPKAEWQA